tara:strand:+ start:2551 stop:2796 length:246 start_codon:yes stop_codon:yes gene_type:complete
MLQYIKWLWVKNENKNDDMVRKMAVYKIENVYLKYKSNQRKRLRENRNIRTLVDGITFKKNKLNNRFSYKTPDLPYKNRNI